MNLYCADINISIFKYCTKCVCKFAICSFWENEHLVHVNAIKMVLEAEVVLSKLFMDIKYLQYIVYGRTWENT